MATTIWATLRRGLIAIVSVGAFAACANAQSGTDISIIVMMETGVKGTVAKAVLTEIEDQFSRYDYYVVPQDMLAADLGWNLEGKFSSQDLHKMAFMAKASGKPEFDVRGVVIVALYGDIQDVGFAKQVMIEVRGVVYDADSKRQLGKFGPERRKFTAPADCGRNCLGFVLREKAGEIAAIVADESRKKLALLTKGGGGGGSTPNGLLTIYTVDFHNFTTRESMEITGTMEEFPGFQKFTGPSGSGVRLKYGYRSTAPSSKIFKWLHIVLMDMGLDTDRNVQIVKSGTVFTLKKLGSDAPPRNKKSTGSRFK